MADIDQTIRTLGKTLMTAVAKAGVIRPGNEADLDLGCRVMREELKALIVSSEDPAGKYSDERALAMTGNSQLAMASVVAECIRRILAERAPC